MSTGRFTAPGKTRSCPHCKATILDSATVCPACHHHLRFDAGAGHAQVSEKALRVDGVLRHPPSGEAWEYSLVLSVRNARGQEVTRQVVGVGALQPGDERTFSLAVELFKPEVAAKPAETAKPAPASGPRAGARPAAPARPAEPSAPAGAPARPADTHPTSSVPTRPRPRLGGR